MINNIDITHSMILDYCFFFFHKGYQLFQHFKCLWKRWPISNVFLATPSLKHLLFHNELLKELLLSNNYFLVTSTFLTSCLIAINTFPTQLLRKNYSLRISIIMEAHFFEAVTHLLRNYFFNRGTFLKSGYFLRIVTFPEKLVLRNQPHNIFPRKDFPSTIIYYFKYTLSWSDFEIFQLPYCWK